MVSAAHQAAALRAAPHSHPDVRTRPPTHQLEVTEKRSRRGTLMTRPSPTTPTVRTKAAKHSRMDAVQPVQARPAARLVVRSRPVVAAARVSAAAGRLWVAVGRLWVAVGHSLAATTHLVVAPTQLPDATARWSVALARWAVSMCHRFDPAGQCWTQVALDCLGRLAQTARPRRVGRD